MRFAGYLLLILVSFVSCRKDITVVPDNDPPGWSDVPTLKIENYLNRLYIDLLGRQPLDTERQEGVAKLRASNLAYDTRLEIVKYLQTSDDMIPNDSSYRYVYHERLYTHAKMRVLEGAPNSEFSQRIGILNFGILVDSLNGDYAAMESKKIRRDRLQQVLNSQLDLMNGQISINTMFARMIHNAVYDEIHMNTFNFVNATFDNLMWRFPTQAEFDAGFSMVEYNLPTILFGNTGQNKDDYVHIFEESYEMFEGLIIWAYQSLLARKPTSLETSYLLGDFYFHRDYKLIQQHLLISDEYANF